MKLGSRTARQHDTAAARKVAGDDGPDVYYHGTSRELRDVVSPATDHRRPVSFPHDTSREHAYATSSVDDAWHYAEKAWSAADSGHPRVYAVTPTGEHEQDPQFDAHGRPRSNFSGDRRSTAPWRILHEVPMPEHMGEPDDWR